MVTLIGLAIVFDSPSLDLGGWVERVSPRAVDRSLRDGDLFALVDHDLGKVIGRQSAATLVATKATRGLAVEILTPNTAPGRDIVELVRRGDVRGMSFGFEVLGDRWDTAKRPPERIIEGAFIREVTVTPFPAYPATTIAVQASNPLRHSVVDARLAAVPAWSTGPRPVTGRRSARTDYPLSRREEATTMELEYATLKRYDGAVVRRAEALRSRARWDAAVKANGGTARRDAYGEMAVDRAGRWITRGLNVAAMEARHREMERQLKREKVTR